MRTLKIILLGMLVLVALSATGWGQVNSTKANIIGSPHDMVTSDTFTAGPTGTTDSAVTTNTCFLCHIIHKTATNSSGIGSTSSLAPGYMLWNHQLSSTANYGVYSSDTFTAVLTAAGVSAPTDLGATNNITSPTVSNLCLSCHDGTIAIASFYESGFGLPAQQSLWYNGHGTAPGSTYMYSGMQLTDLTKTHPVHFQYTPGLAAAANMTSPASTNSVDGSGAVPLYGGAYYLECTTCHDPHNGTTIKSGTAVPFARLALQNAENSGTGKYCTYCHT